MIRLKKILQKAVFFGIALSLTACFQQIDVSVPRFIPKNPPDSLVERGIDAHPDNAIYLEWEEPETAAEEGILGYYVYRGKLVDQEYTFSRVATVQRTGSILFDSDNYTDYTVHLDTTYYYYLKSYNDFTSSKATSDTVFYKLAHKPSLYEPQGDIYLNKPFFEFRYTRTNIDRISYFYFRLDCFDQNAYKNKLFIKIHRFDLSKTTYRIYLNNFDTHTTILKDSLSLDGQDQRYLEKGNYRWRVDAVSGELGGQPETVGSESGWMFFTVK